MRNLYDTHILIFSLFCSMLDIYMLVIFSLSMYALSGCLWHDGHKCSNNTLLVSCFLLSSIYGYRHSCYNPMIMHSESCDLYQVLRK